MKTIIAGGRDYRLTEADRRWLDTLPITEVVSGGCVGTDVDAENWAFTQGLKIRHFKPDWNTYGKSAGPIRNAQMAKYAEAVVLFPGGRGTASMRREAVKRGLKIYERS